MKYLFDLPAERGGSHVSDTIPEAVLWATDRSREWELVFRGKNLREARNVAALGGAFIQIADELQGYLKAPRTDGSGPLFDQTRLICRDSPMGVALQEVLKDFGVAGMSAAAASVGVGPDPLNWQDNEQAFAVLRFRHEIDRYREKSFEHGKTMAQVDLEMLQRDVTTARADLKSLVVDSADLRKELDGAIDTATTRATLEATDVNLRLKAVADRVEERYTHLSNSIAGSQADLEQIEPGIADAKAESAKAVAEFAAGLKSEYAAWVLAQQEQGRLEAPARLWASRAKLHTKAANRQRWVILGFGILGLIATVCIADWAFGFAGVIFSNAATDRLADLAPADRSAIIRAAAAEALRKGETAQLLRPTLHLEAIFAGAVTLLWLTMYVWGMRLLVKIYTTEKHLAINASGRSAMVTTYLGLIKQQAANEADRPIVLSAIFEPLKDGFVNDDGPPQMSLPAVLSAFLASKGGGGGA